MSRDKQIDEIYNDLVEIFDEEYGKRNLITPQNTAEKMNAKGYRKASEVAREIFEEMREELVRYLMLNENIAIKCKEENGEWNAEYWKGKLSAFKQIQGFIDTELKKKYTEEQNVDKSKNAK